MSTTGTPQDGPGWVAKGIVIAVLAACAVCFVLGLIIFKRDFGGDEAMLSKDPVPKSHLVFHITVASIDPTNQAASLTITPEPAGSMTSDSGYTAKQDIEFNIVTDLDTKNVKIKAGSPMVTTTVPIPAAGEIAAYPNDAYSGNVEIDSDTPMVIDAESHLQPYGADMTLDSHSTPDALIVNFEFGRSASIVIFAWFLYAMIGLVSLVALIVALTVFFGSHKWEFGMMLWVAALLFVLPGIRNALPGQPPIGTIGDFAIFFWAEVLVVLALLMQLWMWWHRYRNKLDS